MATIRELIERIETRLFMLSGLDVQIHAESQIIEMLRGVYNTLFDDFWYPEYTFFRTEVLDGVTGQVTTDLSNEILRYKDIHTVYYGDEERPLPRIAPGSSVGRIRSRSMLPVSDPTKVFKVVPSDEVEEVHIWYRTKISDEVWFQETYDTPLMFDDEVLMYGVVYEFLINDGSNMEATAEYKNKFQGRQQQMREAQWNIPLQKKKLERDGPATRWE